jgi:hypothetical protein
MINVMAAQVGYGEGLYPDPWHTAATMLHLDTRETPGVFESRVPRTPARPMENELGLVSEGSSWLPELELPLPPFSEWQAYAGSQLSREGDGVRVVAETTRYQYIAGSPRIPVPQTHMIVVRLRMRLERGHVCVGVLNSTDAKWITPPVEFRQQYTFDAAENDSVRLVIANCNPLRLERDRASLYVWSGSYADGGPTRTLVVPRPSATPSAQ